MVNRVFSLSDARSIVPAGSAQRARWEARAREFEAVRMWEKNASERTLEQLAVLSPCSTQPVMRIQVRERLASSDWQVARSEMKAANADEAALAAAWWLEAGRGAFDIPVPASAARGAR